MLNVRFFGVRGSTPCSCESNQRYGGNTACVVVRGDTGDPIVLDLGTGLRFWGLEPQPEPFRATALVTHLHWDHVQGLPFFTPMHREGASMRIIGPRQHDRTLRDAFDEFLRPPYFPVSLDQLAGSFEFAEVGSDRFPIGEATVTSAWVPHVGPTVGYRIELGGRSIAYISDHQQPGCASTRVDDEVLRLCEGVDVLIHDAQYTEAEFLAKYDWGHCTVDYAVEVAAQARVGQLVLFHHDPSHDDTMVDAVTAQAAHLAGGRSVPVIAAYEGLELQLG